MGLHRVAQMGVVKNFIAIPPAIAFAGDDPAVFEIGDDLLHGPFRDTDFLGDIPQTAVGILRQTGQDMGVIGQERPTIRIAGGSFGIRMTARLGEKIIGLWLGLFGCGIHGEDKKAGANYHRVFANLFSGKRLVDFSFANSLSTLSQSSIMVSLDLVLHNLLSPVVLTFVLGILAVFVKSDLKFPEELYQGLTIYLLLAIGFKGGAALTRAPVDEVALAIVVAVGLGLVIPVGVFAFFRWARLSAIDAAAMGAHYGSVSAVTFIAALGFLTASGIEYEPYLTAVMAVMEAPAILSALFLAAVFVRNGSGQKIHWGHVFSECLTGKSVLLLLGGIAIGLLSGESGYQAVEPFLVAPFTGVLMLFLLEMGLVAGRRLKDFRQAGLQVGLFAVIAPNILAILGIATSAAAGLPFTVCFIMGVLAGSGSYIAAPAAVRANLPEANPGFYMTASLGITFPYNLTVGIPLYYLITGLIVGNPG